MDKEITIFSYEQPVVYDFNSKSVSGDSTSCYGDCTVDCLADCADSDEF